MQPSDAEHTAIDTTPPGQALAVWAESLYLANMLLLPGPSFLALLYLYGKHARGQSGLAACHLRQTVAGSLWAAALLGAANALIILLGGYDAPSTWVVVILYFVCCHSALVMLGVVGLAKAMSGQPYRYPVVGRRCT
jgi:hypothetical protein